MRPVPAACLPLIHQFEGNNGTFEPIRAYDPAGNPEIGWSHKLSGPADPLWFAALDADQADALAMEDLTKAASGVCNILGPSVSPLTANQYAALIDFTYECGLGAFAGSTLCHFVKTGRLDLVPDQLGLWIHARVAGIETVMEGMVRRRAAEVELWRT